jgi:hypothetical protein
LDAALPLAAENRAQAFAGISSEEQKVLKDLLERISRNCVPDEYFQ